MSDVAFNLYNPKNNWEINKLQRLIRQIRADCALQTGCTDNKRCLNDSAMLTAIAVSVTWYKVRECSCKVCISLSEMQKNSWHTHNTVKVLTIKILAACRKDAEVLWYWSWWRWRQQQTICQNPVNCQHTTVQSARLSPVTEGPGDTDKVEDREMLNQLTESNSAGVRTHWHYAQTTNVTASV